MKQVIKFKNGDSWITAGKHIGQFEVKIAPQYEPGDRLYCTETERTAIIVSGPHRDYTPAHGGETSFLVKYDDGNSYYHEVITEKDLGEMRPVS